MTTRTSRSTAGISSRKPETLRSAAKRAAPRADRWVLRLYIAGRTTKAVTALDNLNAICERELKGKFTIEVIDLLLNPRLARAHQILAVPTLVRKIPLPVRKIIGDLSDTEGVLVGLDLIPHLEEPAMGSSSREI